MNILIEGIKTKFIESFSENPQMIVRSPGRINLIGEHTDYNDGFVLPAAIDREMIFAISPRNDKNCEIIAYNLEERLSFSVDNLSKNQANWSNYLKGVIQQIQLLKHEIKGFNLVFGGNIPVGAGISSSAALEAGLAFALNELFELQIPRTTLAKICQNAENQFVGLSCGIMDMFASLMGQTDSVIRLDCQSLASVIFRTSQGVFHARIAQNDKKFIL